MTALPGLLWISLIIFLLLFFSLIRGGGRGGRTTVACIDENKIWKKEVWNLGLVVGREGGRWEVMFLISRNAWQCFFSCFRHTIFCKLTVTSVLFNVYYMDNGLTSNWGGMGVPDHHIFTMHVCVSVYVCKYECAYV